MRVLIVHTIYKIKGGEDSVVDNEAELLRSAGYQVELLTFFNNGNTALKLIQLPFNLSSYFATLKKIREFKPEVMHIHNLHFAGSPSVLYAAKKLKVPVVITLHNYRLLCPSGTLFFDGQLFTSSVNEIFAAEAVKKGVYKNSKLITFWVALSGAMHQLAGTWKIPSNYIVLGPNAKEIFTNSKLNRIADKMVIKPNFCYPGELRVAGEGGYYLYVGRLSEEKGISVLLAASKNFGAPIKIAGSGPLEEEVKLYASQYPNIEFLGPQHKDEVRKLLAGAKALVFPSVWHETFGMVIIEAFSSGVPVIASAMGEAKNLVVDKFNGLLFTPGDEASLLGQLEYFEELDAEGKMEMSKNALESYNTQYTPAENLKRLNHIYSSARQSNK